MQMATNRIKAESVAAATLKQVRVVEGEKAIRETCSDYLTDESRYGDAHADRLFYARFEAEVVAVVKWAQSTKTTLTLSAGRTGLTGGAVPFGGAILTLEPMNALLAVGFDETAKDWYVRVQPGVTWDALNNAVHKKQLSSLQGKGTPAEQAALTRFLRDPKSYFLPPDPTETTSHLGASVAANASGARSFRYGAIRNWTRRLRVVLANGDVLDIRRGAVTTKTGEFIVELTNGTTVKVKVPSYRMPSVKNAAGLYAKPEMDFIDLFIGSEGILGAITEVELRLLEYPEHTLTVFAFFPSEAAAIAFVKDVRGEASPVKPLLLEYFDSHAVQMLRDARAKGSGGVMVPAQVETAQAIIFFEVPFKEAEMESTFMAVQDLLAKHKLGMDASWAGMEPADLERMKAVRHLIPETVNSIIAQRKQKHPLVHKLGTDMAVPNQHLETIISYYKKLLDEAGMEYIIFGHIGDNHLHVNILPRTDAEVHKGMAIYQRFARKAVELGGTVSAEHGIGKLKRPFLRVMYGDEGLAQIAQVKKALDPNWILNPSNMIPRPGETLEALDE
jgi:D-lactate dehydrogenase (cytochrome)